MNKTGFAAVLLLMAAPAVHAQQWLANTVNSNQIVEWAICDSAMKKHQPLPSICAKYPKYAGAASSRANSAPPAKAVTPGRAAAASLKFTPVAGDATARKLADSLGGDARQRQQVLQLMTAGKQIFEQHYGARGWKNNVAGAYAFFVGSMTYVWSGRESDDAMQNRMFDAMAIALAESPDVSRASNNDKAELYDTLIAAASLSLVLYIDGTQKGDASEVEQAKAMAAEYSRKIMHVEPDTLTELLK